MHPEVEGGVDAIKLLGTGVENHKNALYTFKEDVLATLAGNSLFLWNFVTKASVNMTVELEESAKLVRASSQSHWYSQGDNFLRR